MSSNILERIENETDLTKSERKLAQVILKDPAIVVNENIAQLAKRAQVSEPSVCRFCKRFGADGFPAFKLVLSAVVSANKVNRVEGVKQGDTVEDVVTKVISLGKNSLLKLEKNIDETMVAKVIDVVSQARRIVVLAQGLNTFVGVDFQNRMLNLGFATELYTDKQAMSLALATLRVSDVALCISSNGEEIDLIEALQA
ncbi:MAG: MurR/RpiR family transcriptional regulator, partial [Succinivibrio sp.]|nr:MurR/RpiR family transcriptional regulator [Succinivibrio sp.]